MRRLIIIAIASLLATGGTAVATPHSVLKGSRYASEARITLPAARTAALKARPGTITDQELEKERGGSGLRYSFDIRAGGKTYEVGIDAKTGAILENGAEGAHPD